MTLSLQDLDYYADQINFSLLSVNKLWWTRIVALLY